MGRHQGQPMITTSVRISPEFHDLCIRNFINFSEAMRVGISMILAERGVSEYDNNLNIFRKMNQLRLKLEETSAELCALQEKYNERIN